jgi:hypothetical protein
MIAARQRDKNADGKRGQWQQAVMGSLNQTET